MNSELPSLDFEIVWYDRPTGPWTPRILATLINWPLRQEPPYAMQVTFAGFTVTLTMSGEVTSFDGQTCPVVFGTIIDGELREHLCFKGVFKNYGWPLVPRAVFDSSVPGTERHGAN